MTVYSSECSKRFHGSGNTGPLNWTWRFMSNEDIVVYKIADPHEEDTSREVLELLVEGDDYTLTGARSYQGGKIILTDALLVGQDVLVKRNTAALQKTSIRDKGNFDAAVHEDVFDTLTMIIQDRDGELFRNSGDITGIKARMATAEVAISAHGGRLDAAESEITSLDGRASVLEDRTTALEGRASAVEGRVTSLEERMAVTEEGEAGREIRVANVETTVASLMESLPPFAAHLQDATEGQVYVDVVAANNPAAKLVIIGKTDDSANAVTLRPTAGTVGGLAEWDIAEQGIVEMFVPNATANNYLKIG